MWILFLIPAVVLLVYLLTRGSSGSCDHGIEEGFVTDTDSSYDSGCYDYY